MADCIGELMQAVTRRLGGGLSLAGRNPRLRPRLRLAEPSVQS